MIGIVLAAGVGKRLRPLTDKLPKTLLPVGEGTTILDSVLGGLAGAGLERAVIVTGHAAGAIEERLPVLGARHGLELSTLFNPEASRRNNAYSLWLTAEALAEGAIVANGDTIYPVSVVETLLGHAREAVRFDVALAVDDTKQLAEEEMKVVADEDGGLVEISKGIDPASAHGEYIGVCLVTPEGATPLVEALESTWRRDADLYYEDAFQALTDRGGRVVTTRLGATEWVEVDDHDDLERARRIGCPS